ncbi:30S ribosomal protein THX [Blattabacterium cuenoti]|nr:30S ribosomal protein THX [Blattabacterium cuenoti]
MGKGDKKTRRGKIRNKTYGNLRPKPKNLRKNKKQNIWKSTSKNLKT